MHRIIVLRKHITHGLVAAMMIMAVISAFAQPDWEVNSSQFEFTMTITGIANIACEESMDTNDIIGAFIEGEIRGVKHVRELFNGHLYAFLLVYDNDFTGNEVNFMIYDASEDTIIPIVPSVIFQENKSVGNTEQPFLFLTQEGITDIELSENNIAFDAKANDVICSLSSFLSSGDGVPASYSLVNDGLGLHNSSFDIVDDELILLEDPGDIGGTTFTIHVAAAPEEYCASDKVFHLEWNQITGIQNVGDEQEEMLVYPNPSRGNISWRSSYPWKYASLFDLQGRKVASSSVVGSSADFTEVMEGMYLLQLSDDMHHVTQLVAIIK
jgi:hypothetical protein